MIRVPPSPAGFSLVEVALALGVASFCLIAVFGLIPVGMQTNRNATAQTVAAGILSSVIADMRGTPNSSPTSAQYGITFGTPATLYFDGEGTYANSLGPKSQYRAAVRFPPNRSGGFAPVYADLTVTWPAAANPATIAMGGSVETFAAFDRH